MKPAAREYHLTNQNEFGVPDFFGAYEAAIRSNLAELCYGGEPSYEGRFQYQDSFAKDGSVAIVSEQGQFYGMTPDLFFGIMAPPVWTQPVVDIAQSDMFGGAVPTDVGGYIPDLAPAWDRTGLSQAAG